jgi:hypothetical protein
MLKRRSRENENLPKKAKVQCVLDFLLDDDSEDNAESEITAFMRERVDPDTDSLAWWKDNSNCHIHDCYSVIVVQSFC